MASLGQSLDRLVARVETLCLWAAVVCLMIAGVLILLTVPARSYVWAQVPDSYLFVKFFLLAAIALGLGQATGTGHHISVDLLYVKFPPRGQLWLRVLGLVVGLMFFVPLAWWYGGQTIEMIERPRSQPGLLRLPRWPLYAMMCFGFSLVALRLFLLLLAGGRDASAAHENNAKGQG